MSRHVHTSAAPPGPTPVHDDSRVEGLRLRRILCALDLSDFSRPVLAHAAALARLQKGSVSALHVFAAIPDGQQMPADGTTAQRLSRTLLTEQLGEVIAPFRSSGLTLSLQTADGDPAARILERADRVSADLVVMGTHGRNGFARLMLGSVAETVLRHSACPVMTVSPVAMTRTVDAIEYRHLLCPTDFSEPSDEALKLALSLAFEPEPALTALHVVEVLANEETRTASPPYIVELRRRQCLAAKALLHDVVSHRAAPDRHVAEMVVLGRPHREILRVASERHADLIVMGVHGRGAFGLSVFGSTANHVIRRAECPVLTCRPR